MGYTHYWRQVRNLTAAEWAQVSADIATILETVEHRAEIRLCNGMGERGTKPEIDSDAISFNGSGDDGHETFVVYRKRPPKEPYQRFIGGNFCKTARKPYDLAVTAVLCYLSTFHLMGDIDEQRKPIIGISSDGKGKDFLAGLETARVALPHLGNILDIPMGIMEDDRWVPPWVKNETKDFQFQFCVDGHAYVMQHSLKRAFRFHTHHLAALWASQIKEKAIVVNGLFGRSCEGGASLFEPMGSFNETRRRAIARQQTDAFRLLFIQATSGFVEKYGEIGHNPPAYVRPGEILTPLDVPGRYWMKDLLQQAETKTA